MKKILLTGATGFIGQHCIPPLSERGYEIHAVSSRKPPKHSLNVFWHRANILDTDQVSGLISELQPTHLLHFAWIVTPGEYWTSLENIRWVQASLDLLLAFVKHGGKRAVIAGTCAEYDWQYGYCSEQITPSAPSTLYGVCKRSLQEMLANVLWENSVSIAWGRIFFLYGPNEPPNRLVASIIRSLLQDKPAHCSHGNQIRDVLYVRDVAEAFVALLDKNIEGPINIASGQPVALKEVVFRIAEKLDRIGLIVLGAIPTPENEPHLLIADTNRLFNEVGWRPKYDLDRGLEETISWWANQLSGEL